MNCNLKHIEYIIRVTPKNHHVQHDSWIQPGFHRERVWMVGIWTFEK